MFNLGERVRCTAPDGWLYGTIVGQSYKGVVVKFDDDTDGEFELGTDGKWYEVNDSQSAWLIEPVCGLTQCLLPTLFPDG